MTNPDIAAVFEQVADLLEFQNANAFRVRAYRNAARTIHDLGESAEEIVRDPDRSLTEIEGIGKDLAEKIATLVQTGSLPMLDELLAEIPESVLAILRVPGLGPKKAAALFRELKVATLDELRTACEAHRVRELAGFGAKSEAAILQGLEIASEAGKRILWAEADVHVQAILAQLRSCKAVKIVEAAGSYRRGKETVGDLDFLAVAEDAAAAMDALAGYEGISQVIARGDTKMSVRLSHGLQVDLRVVPEESFGAAWQYFTGSKEHNIVLRGRAKERGLKINEYGVFHGEKSIAGRTEEDVYATLGLPCFPPELREARREFQWADAGQLPMLIEPGDIRGDLHTHSIWTDGLATIEEMASAAKERGLEYIAITDHSKRVAMVGGLDEKRLRAQWQEIDSLNERLRGITILKSVEVDILERGGLDISDEVLAEADWIVASLHYGHNQPREQITRRAIDALENPYVCALGHPTGRMLLARRPYEIDLDAVIKAAGENGKFLELNAHPKRLDLDDVACAAAKDRGVRIVISTDAHRPAGLDVMRYGILQARRGGLTKEDVINTRPWGQVKKLLGRRFSK
ncbi:MAG: DNA polymerase/3'-5' exonuclease PolX [Pirellulales bacterium]|nr:DNA polymerase/3'-5' exonuclease PolX [Pirellulales bacterium]